MSQDDDPNDDRTYSRFITKDQAIARLNRLIGRLYRSNDDQAHWRLAQKLGLCSDYYPCGSGACPVCMRTNQLRWIDEICKLFQPAAPATSDIAFISLILADVLIAPGQLHTFDPDRFRDRIAELLDRAGLITMSVVSALDFRLIVWSEISVQGWQPFLPGLAHCPMGVVRAKGLLLPHVPANEFVPEPVVFDPVRPEDLPRIAGGTLSSRFRQHAPRVSERTGKRLVRTSGLPLWARRELAVYLDTTPITGRLFLKNGNRSRDGLRVIPQAKKS